MRCYLRTMLVALIAAWSAACMVRADVPSSSDYAQLAAPYVAADVAGKQQWLEKLLQRSDNACRAYMPPAELELQRARHREILRRAAVGQELSTEGLVRLLGEVDRQEKSAIARLSRDYAFLTAQTFHDNRPQFDKWTEAWQQLERNWQLQDRPMSSQPDLIAWLEQAPNRLSLARATAARQAPAAVPRVVRRTGPPVRRAELESRIAGYNLALSRLLSQLHVEKQWTATELARIAGELADLATARHDLTLYRNLLAPADRQKTPVLQPLDSVISLLSTRTAERRRQLEVTTNDDAPRTAWELRRLDEVSRRLATLASERS